MEDLTRFVCVWAGKFYKNWYYRIPLNFGVRSNKICTDHRNAEDSSFFIKNTLKKKAAEL